jgi:hypothetical protein
VGQAEPAAFARRLFRAVAGEDHSPARRILATTVIVLAALLAILVLLVSFLVLVTLLGTMLNAVAPPRPRRGAPVISWFLVSATTAAFVGIAMAVSWTSRRREDARTQASQPLDGDVRREAARPDALDAHPEPPSGS